MDDKATHPIQSTDVRGRVAMLIAAREEGNLDLFDAADMILEVCGHTALVSEIGRLREELRDRG